MEQGLWELRQRHQFIDAILRIGDRTYECHKLVLSAFPGYFRDLFTLDFAESHRDEIEIHINDPRGNFDHILRYLYTKSSSFVNPRNAFQIWELATYFRLSDLKNAASAILSKVNSSNIQQFVEQLEGSPISITPPHILDLIAEAFPRISITPAFADFPPFLILQVLSRPGLKIISERQLIDVVSSVHVRCPLSQSALANASKWVCWQYLTDEDWETANWRLFINEERKEKICEMKKGIVGENKHIEMVLMALNATNPHRAVKRIASYVATPVKMFGIEDKFFENSTKFGVAKRTTNFPTTETVYEMASDAGIYFFMIKFVLSAFVNGGDLKITRKWLVGNEQDIAVYQQEKVGPTGVFRIKWKDRIPIKSIKFEFPGKVRVKWNFVESTAKGFFFTW
jgi:hypothetical protein